MKIWKTIALIVILLAAPASAQDAVWQYDAIMPWDAERLTNNNTLITEYGNHTVIEVNTTTKEIIWQYGTGTSGSDPGQLNSPVDAERLSSNNTLITDRNNHRVIEVNTTGAIVWQYGTTGTSGSGYDQLYNPMDAERLSNGNTLIADRLNNRVIEVNESKGIVWEYGITNPFDADRLSNGNTLIVEYTNHRVIEINETDEIVWQYGNGTSGSGVNQLNYPMDAERLANGNTLITDYINDRVIEVRTSDYDPAEPDNNFTAESIVWEHGSNHPADAERLSSGSTLICEAGSNSVVEIAPDILPLAVEIPVLYANLTCEIDALILNNGSGPTGVFNVSLIADGSTVDTVGVNSLGAGERAGVSFSWSPSDTGDSELCVVTDSDFDVIELSETNNVWCENATVRQFSPCWNDSFDDETKIAGKNYVIVENGDVKMDLDAVNPFWSPSSVARGLYNPSGWTYGVTTIAYNLRGDDKWIAIMDTVCNQPSYCQPRRGFYWNDIQWIEDNSLVSGLPEIIFWPVIAFNITGDERWNIITPSTGYYWDGNTWVSNSSLATGLEGKVSTIAFNITGDGKWNAIGSGKGYYWNGTQWIIDSRLGGLEEWVQVGFNMRGDGGWNAFSGNSPSHHWKINPARGWYWNGTQWVEDPSLVDGFPGIKINTKPVIAFNITGDGRWNAIAYGFQGYELFYPANIISDVISLPPDYHWLEFHANDTLPDHTCITYKILDRENNTLMNVVPGQVLTDITDTPFRLFAELRVNKPLKTPVLHNWSVCWEEGLPASGVLKEKKRLTSDPNSSTSPDVAADSEGNLHLVWYDDLGEGSGLYYKKLATNGMVLVDDKMVSPGSGSRIAVDSSDNVHVVFNDGTNSINVSYMKLDNFGNTLIEPKQVISGIYCGGDWFPAKPCGIAVDGSGNVHVVACCNCGPLKHGDMQDLKYVKLDNEGNKLVNYTIEHLTTPGASGTWDCLGMPPSGIAVDSAGNAYTAYSKGLCGAYGAGTTDCYWPSCLKAYYVKIDSEGVHKQELTSELPGLPLPSLYPSVCVDSGDNKYVVWSQHNRTATIAGSYPSYYRILHGFDFYLTKFDKSDNKVIDRKRLTFEDYPVESGLYDGHYYLRGIRRPIIATESGVIHAAWSVPEPKAGENGNIWYIAFDTSGNKLMDAVILSPPSAETAASNPNMDSVQDGAHLGWNEKREHDAGSEIYYARLVFPPDRVFLITPPDKWTAMNVTATYAIGILHTMPGSETFNLTLENLDGTDVAELSSSTITLAPNDIGEVILNVTDAVLGDYRVKVSVESQSNPEINASGIITTSVIVPEADLIITAIDAYHNDTGYAPYFNIPNEVDVTVKNIGTAHAGAFNVSLYADGEFIGKKNVSGLELDSSTLLQFKWTPTGLDCEDGGFQQTYTLKAIADCDNDTVEMNEANNESTTQETVYWAGYSADEPINAIAWHGMLHGGLHYTTGDGRYMGLYTPGNSEDTHYSITLPAGASIELARLNVYYTWSQHSSTGVYPVMEVRITNTTGTYLVASAAEYNDRPCESPAIGYDYPFGNYVYDLTPYITGDGSYTVNVKNVGSAYYSFCIAAPGLVILYEDETKPEYEFWILEGADLLEGGHRGGAGNLDLSDCICNATFTGEVDTDKVENATLGIVSAWGGAAWGEDWTSYYWFNNHYLGDGSMLGGYGSLYDKTVNGISMYAGASGNAQVGVNVSDVTSYITGDDNTLAFGDDGDSMMAANAFLALERGAGTSPAPLLIYGRVNYPDGGPANDCDVVIMNLNTSQVLALEMATDSNYYQAVTSSHDVSVGDLLNFNASNGNMTELNHTVTPEEMDDGCFVQNLTVGRPGICGDVNVDGDADMTDVMTLWYDIADYPYAGAYTISDAWAADVNCDGDIDMTDVMTLWYDIADYPSVGAYEVECCE